MNSTRHVTISYYLGFDTRELVFGVSQIERKKNNLTAELPRLETS